MYAMTATHGATGGCHFLARTQRLSQVSGTKRTISRRRDLSLRPPLVTAPRIRDKRENPTFFRPLTTPTIMSRPIAPTPARQRGLSRMLLLGILVGMALLIGGGGAFYYTTKSNANAAPKPLPPKVPVFVAISPMTINLSDQVSTLYIGMSLAVTDKLAADRLQQNMPIIRDRMLRTLSEQSADRMVSADGKRDIAEKLRETLNAPYGEDETPVAIENVLFTDFIVQ